MYYLPLSVGEVIDHNDDDQLFKDIYYEEDESFRGREFEETIEFKGISPGVGNFTI